MLSREDNELLCRVGRGTPMGELMRQYWMPAALSSELPERDGAPLRVRLLGEDLIAFRTTSGAVGLVRNSCPHRGASLFYGRNEAEGLRCVYHGWKFDVAGRCVDMPNEPEESSFKQKVRAVAYPCVERAGLIWAYLGPRETPPPLPELEPTLLADASIQIYQRECNWMHTLAITVARGPQGTRNAGRQVVRPPRTLPNTTDWYGRFRCVANAANDYQIDRTAQKTISYTGIDAIFLQDQAVTESMGVIYDRTNERLGSSDAMVIRTRKRLIDAAKALRDSGKVPPGVDDPSVYAVRSGGVVLPRGADWIDATRELRRAGVTHRGLTRDVLGGMPAV